MEDPSGRAPIAFLKLTMSRFRSIAFLLLATTLVLGCNPDVTGPGAMLEGLPEGLRVELTVEPAIVSPHRAFTARLTVTNTTPREVEVVTAHSCLVIAHVMRGETRVPFEGSSWGCYAAITRHVFAPGETRTLVWELRAELYAEHPGDTDGAPASPGVYRVRAEFDTYLPDDPTRKPAIERGLIVR